MAGQAIVQQFHRELRAPRFPFVRPPMGTNLKIIVITMEYALWKGCASTNKEKRRRRDRYPWFDPIDSSAR